MSGQLDPGILTLQAFDGRNRDALERAFFLSWQEQHPELGHEKGL
jgi:hypothetical protein